MAVPQTKTWAELGFKGVPETQVQVGKGVDLFEKLPDANKERILGSRSAFEAYKAGAVKLSDFVGRRRSRDWGTMRYARSLIQVLGKEEAKRWGEIARMPKWEEWNPGRADTRLVGRCGDQLRKIIGPMAGVRDVYVSESTIKHYIEKHSGEFDVSRAEAMLERVVADPEFVYQNQKKTALLFVGDFDEDHYLIVPVKVLPGELWLETLYLHNRGRFQKRVWAKTGVIYKKKK